MFHNNKMIHYLLLSLFVTVILEDCRSRHIAISKDCRKFGCDIAKLSFEQNEIDKRVRFLLHNKWVQQLHQQYDCMQRTSLISSHSIKERCSKEYITKLTSSFEQVDGKWFLVNKKHENLNYILIKYKSDTLYIEGYHEIGVQRLNEIYNMHHRLQLLDLYYSPLRDQLLLNLYNYFKPS